MAPVSLALVHVTFGASASAQVLIPMKELVFFRSADADREATVRLPELLLHLSDKVCKK